MLNRYAMDGPMPNDSAPWRRLCEWCDQPSARPICPKCLGHVPPVRISAPAPVVAVRVAAVKVAKPPKPKPAPRPKPAPKVRMPRRKRPCAYPGCVAEVEAILCHMHGRRARKLGMAKDTDPVALAAAWDDHMRELGDRHAESGASLGRSLADNPGRRAIMALLEDGSERSAAEFVAASGFDPSSIWRVLRAAGAVMVRRGVWRLSVGRGMA